MGKMPDKWNDTFDHTLDSHSMIKPDVWYSMNINPSIQRQWFTDPTVKHLKSTKHKYLTIEERKESFNNEWKAILRDWQYQQLMSEYEFFLEISPNGLLHYHGKFKTKYPIKLLHQLGIIKYCQLDVRIEIDTINDMTKWDLYISKDHLDMQTKITTYERHLKDKSKPVTIKLSYNSD